MKQTVTMFAVMTTDVVWERVVEVPDDADDIDVINAIAEAEVIEEGDFKEADSPFARRLEIVDEEVLAASPDAEPAYFLDWVEGGELEVLDEVPSVGEIINRH